MCKNQVARSNLVRQTTGVNACLYMQIVQELCVEAVTSLTTLLFGSGSKEKQGACSLKNFT